MLPDLSLYYPLSRTFFFFFNDTATTEIYTLSLHDALPISPCRACPPTCRPCPSERGCHLGYWRRSEEHTSELQSRLHLVCRLLLEKKKQSVVVWVGIGAPCHVIGPLAWLAGVAGLVFVV